MLYIRVPKSKKHLAIRHSNLFHYLEMIVDPFFSYLEKAKRHGNVNASVHATSEIA